MAEKPLVQLFEEKARAGDGDFAIAVSLLAVSDAIAGVGRSIDRLGNGNAATDVGAIEGLSMVIKEAAQIIADGR